MLLIALNGKNIELNEELLEHLVLFYRKKQYKVTTVKEQDEKPIQYILNNTITDDLLLNAFQRSKNIQTNKLQKYDLIFINGSIIDDYNLILNTSIPANYITKINKYHNIYDLYLNIGEHIPNIPKIYPLKNIKINNETFENTVKTIFNELPRCQWCGKLFKPDKKHYKYCDRIYKGKTCSEYGWEENNRRNNREYYKRNKDNMTEKQKNGLGSKNAYLGGTPEDNPLAELEKVRKGKRALGLKPIN